MTAELETNQPKVNWRQVGLYIGLTFGFTYVLAHPLSVVYNSKTRQLACLRVVPARNLAEISPESQAEHPKFNMLPPFSIKITAKDREEVPLPSIFDWSAQPA